jgi:hypothetical protein
VSEVDAYLVHHSRLYPVQCYYFCQTADFLAGFESQPPLAPHIGPPGLSPKNDQSQTYPHSPDFGTFGSGKEEGGVRTALFGQHCNEGYGQLGKLADPGAQRDAIGVPALPQRLRLRNIASPSRQWCPQPGLEATMRRRVFAYGIHGPRTRIARWRSHKQKKTGVG